MYLRRQNMNSKLGEEQKSPNFDSNSEKKQKKGQNDNGLILGLGRVRVMPYYSAEYSDSTRHIPNHEYCREYHEELIFLLIKYA